MPINDTKFTEDFKELALLLHRKRVRSVIEE